MIRPKPRTYDAENWGNKESSVDRGGPASAGMTAIWDASIRDGPPSVRTKSLPRTKANAFPGRVPLPMGEGPRMDRGVNPYRELDNVES